MDGRSNLASLMMPYFHIVVYTLLNDSRLGSWWRPRARLGSPSAEAGATSGPGAAGSSPASQVGEIGSGLLLFMCSGTDE